MTIPKAFICPGQGSQFIGMGFDLYQNSPVARLLFEELDSIRPMLDSTCAIAPPEI